MAPQALPTSRVTKAHLELLRSLSEAVCVSGDEGAVRKMVRQQIEPIADDLMVDAMGNLLATRRGRGRNRVRVMVAAHMDEVGFMITDIDSDGYLRFESVGGLDERQLLGKPVWLGADRQPGVIGAKPIHLAKTEELKRIPKVEDLRIDLGASSKEEAREKVGLGDRGTFATAFTPLGSTIRGKALDDRVGVATLIELVRNPPPNLDLLAAFPVQEEVGLRGARIAAFSLQPEAAIALDCTPAMDLPTWEGDENVAYNTVLGKGPAIYISDRATIADPRLLKLFVRTAEEEGIAYQIRQPGSGGTDAGSIHLTREGIPSISLSVPARYLHTPASIASLHDWRASVRLTHAALSRLRRSTLR